jgi:hypothetical protein
VTALHGPFRENFAAASHVGWWIMTGCGVAILGLGLLVSGRWARETARRTAALLPETASGADESGRTDLQAARLE